MNKVIITGVTGFMGGALARRLLDEDIMVFGIGRNVDKINIFKKYKNFVPILADFSQYFELHDIIKDRKFDAIYHFAWNYNGNARNNLDIQLLNIKASSDLVRSANILGCSTFIFASSIQEFLVNNFDINIYNRCSIYGAAKTSAKNLIKVLCNKYNIKYKGVLCTHNFGIGDMSKNSINTLLNQLINGISPRLTDGHQLYDWLYIDDAINGIILTNEYGIPGKDYYVGSNKLTSFRDIITEVRDIISPNLELTFGEYIDSSYIDYKKIDIYELYRDTGYKPKCNFKESILKTADWVRTLNFD